MARTKLIKLLLIEADQYLRLPYMSNRLKDGKIIKERFLGGKGHWQEIYKQSQKIAQKNKLDFKKLTPQQKYNLQKKNQIGIDCSGLVSQLLNFYAKLLKKNLNLNPRITSAKMLTSLPLSKEISDYHYIQSGDIVKQKDGHHVLFILEKQGQNIKFIESSKEKRGVNYGQFKISDKDFSNQGIYRLLFFD